MHDCSEIACKHKKWYENNQLLFFIVVEKIFDANTFVAVLLISKLLTWNSSSQGIANIAIIYMLLLCSNRLSRCLLDWGKIHLVPSAPPNNKSYACTSRFSGGDWLVSRRSYSLKNHLDQEKWLSNLFKPTITLHWSIYGLDNGRIIVITDHANAVIKSRVCNNPYK